MEIDKFIKIYDNIFQVERVASLVKYICNKVEFKDAEILGKNNKIDIINKNIRNTQTYSFNSKSLTSVHWGQYLRHIIVKIFTMYNMDHPTHAEKVQTIEVLKYPEGGFYKVHSDHHEKMPRTLSVIIFLNNDYEGGELNFLDPVTNEIYKTIKPFPGRCIMWPSNFMYPHSVSPVTKGTRYAIVSWLT